ncbi:MAG: hypothetical protein L0G23_04640 [Ruaniaceae bacterium]|nr:hypothetical protein [Ruaniaceae bacterium]
MRSPIAGGILVALEMLAMVGLLYLSDQTSGTLSTVLHVAAFSLIMVGGWTTWFYSRSHPRDE